MDQRIPAVLHPLLEGFIRRIEQELPGCMTAFYMEGSIALDGFNPRLSDVDFLAVLSKTPTSQDVAGLLQIHHSLENQFPQWELSGMYFQAGDLGCLDQAREPFLNYYDGKLKWSDHFGLSTVTWWILKNHGLALLGPSPQSLDITVNMDQLIQAQRENLNTYWDSWTTRLDGILGLVTDWGIQWTVLGVLRQFYTIRERQITSKIQAGRYALACLPERWHPIIREAIAMREEPRMSCYQSRLKRAFDAFRFLKYAIKTCNKYVAPGLTSSPPTLTS